MKGFRQWGSKLPCSHCPNSRFGRPWRELPPFAKERRISWDSSYANRRRERYFWYLVGLMILRCKVRYRQQNLLHRGELEAYLYSPQFPDGEKQRSNNRIARESLTLDVDIPTVAVRPRFGLRCPTSSVSVSGLDSASRAALQQAYRSRTYSWGWGWDGVRNARIGCNGEETPFVDEMPTVADGYEVGSVFNPVLDENLISIVRHLRQVDPLHGINWVFQCWGYFHTSPSGGSKTKQQESMESRY